jgi:capsular polysaccharide biosynthesis protein
VSVTDSDPVVAKELANGMSRAFVTEALKIDPVTSGLNGQSPGAPTSPVTITQEAELPTAPLSNGLSRNLILSGIFGLLVAIAVVMLLDYLDLSVKTPEDLERRAGLPVLGIIPQFPELPARDEIHPGIRIVGAEPLAGQSSE